MDHLDELENRSIYVIREAYHQTPKLAMLWSIGKDSTTLLWLCRKAFFGPLPFPVVHIDTSYKFQDIYRFRDEYAKEWGVDLVVGRNEPAIASGMGPGGANKLDCCMALKTEALRRTIREHGFEALLLGIRRDEHGIRAKERYFSPRDAQFRWNYEEQPPELWDQFQSRADDEIHMRIHPLLHWTERDIWRYIRREHIPAIGLYFSSGGRRYRSIGCEPCCAPVESEASTIDDIIVELDTTKQGERSGRAQDKESTYTMQKLRALGYM